MEDKFNNVGIEFFKGDLITSMPKIEVIRNNDGRTGKAVFLFKEIEEVSNEFISKISQMTMKDPEGEIITKKINIIQAKNNRNSIEVIYTWREDIEFKRFMRFACNYAITQGLSPSIEKMGD